MSSHHEAFKALGPVDWESFSQEDSTRMTDIFSDAHCLIDSIPGQDDSLSSRSAEPSQQARELRKEWKEVKLNPRDNPLGLNIYKLAAKDGKGAWFARRSVHDGQGFRKWKTGLEREFEESLKVQGQPGDGKIRGLSAERRVVDRIVDDHRKIQVYQLSAQFPVATPRDFVTLCLTSDNSMTTSAPNEAGKSKYFMLVSKPCTHPECPERQGFVRGYYESVELIREITVGNPSHNVTSSSNSASEDPSLSTTSNSGNISKESVVSQNGEPRGNEDESHEEGDSTIEWIMITRSDPGGSVPRFIIEKKTPDGIANDANKFFHWISSEKFEMLLRDNFETMPHEDRTASSAIPIPNASETLSNSISTSPNNVRGKPDTMTAQQEDSENVRSPGPGGVYGMISGALSTVASAAASRLLGPPEEDDSESEVSTPDVSDGASSIRSFHSFNVAPPAKAAEDEEPAISISSGTGGDSVHSAPSPHQEKELKKLEQRRQKAEEKMRRAEERALAKKNDDAQRDQLALQKLREKYERGIAKQEEKYQRERQKLEAKRAAEERKAEARRRKQLERDDKANLALELDKARTERDGALKEIEVLKEQIKQHQAVNAKLVARLYREGITVDDSLTPSSGTPGSLSRSVTEQDLDKKSIYGKS
ncbi:hypothetical protein F5Y09DRAFT_304854 [Xylaria sp. FL1042]|nr:hypothetical protein F5Y09DRAFT_304854 [Xylaria sp. FL1042]